MPSIPLDLAKQLARLPKPKLQRLIEIRRAYPNTPFENLPADLRQEVLDILHSAPASTQGETVQIDKPF